jgi:tetrapyrrole methylase family protein/MazG family protein
METKFIELVKIIKKLREPDGCPWDKEQDLYSLKEYLIEETYELIDALDNKNIENIKEELGDILLHVIFHANIAEEDDLFTLKDVIETITDKMIRRHPHVFGDTKADTTEEVLKNWDIIKSDEKQEI